MNHHGRYRAQRRNLDSRRLSGEISGVEGSASRPKSRSLLSIVIDASEILVQPMSAMTDSCQTWAGLDPPTVPPMSAMPVMPDIGNQTHELKVHKNKTNIKIKV